MKALNLTSWSIFFLGLVGKFLHYPTTILMMLGCVMLLIHGFIILLKNIKTNQPQSLLPLSFTFLTIYLLFRIQYWDFAFYVFVLTFLMVITCLILYPAKKIKFKLPQVILLLYFAFIFLLSFTQAYKVYYFVNLNTVLNGQSRETNYYTWDKYSWFLYIAGKQEEAIQANANAQKAVATCLSLVPDEGATEYLPLLKQHEELIKNKTWLNYSSDLPVGR